MAKRSRTKQNDEKILDAARAVFIADPGAPIAQVAARAGVGISALYRRYASKEALLAALCRDGLERYIAEARAALDDPNDPWTAFTAFMARLAEANTHALVLRLAGTFAPTPELYEMAAEAQRLNEEIFSRVQGFGVLRSEIEVNDINVIGELVASVALGSGERNSQLRQRYLTLLLNGLLEGSGSPPPGPPPTWEEIEARWRT